MMAHRTYVTPVQGAVRVSGAPGYCDYSGTAIYSIYHYERGSNHIVVVDEDNDWHIHLAEHVTGWVRSDGKELSI